MRWPLWFLGGLAVGSLVWGSCQSQRASRFQATKDSALAVSQLQDSIAQESARAADSASTVARAALSASRALQRRSDSLLQLIRSAPPVRPPDSTSSDSIRYFRERHQNASDSAQALAGAVIALQGSLDSLGVAFAAQVEATAQFRGAYETERSRSATLEAALRQAPTPCPRIPLIGLPVPKLGPGAALTTRGVVPALALVIPLGGC